MKSPSFKKIPAAVVRRAVARRAASVPVNPASLPRPPWKAGAADSADADSAALADEQTEAEPYRVFVERMQEGAVTVSLDGQILYCNQRFADMLGQPLERVVESSLAAHLLPEAWRHLAEELGGGREVVRFETLLRREADTGMPVTFTARRLSPDSPAVACLVTDLTTRKEKEDLRLAKEAAEKASAAKDDFLAEVSHELRTPLTPALMAATVLEKDPGLPESARSDISLIRRNIELEARLIDDLLDLTLITRGKLTLQTAEINLHVCLNRALEACQGEARQKRQTLQIDLGAARTLVMGDAVRVQQVCWNILRNAIKFTPERGNIAIATGNEGKDQVWVRISDSGLGFTPDEGRRLFDAFGQGGRHLVRRYGGLGLGLAISRSIMDAHHGSIEGTSPGPNRGATFTLRFPLAGRTASPAAPGAIPGVTRTRGLHILLVEDHKDTRVCIQRLLEATSCQISSAGTATDALALAESARFDLVISDLGLPDMSGHELMRTLHARHGLSGIALSGYGMEADLERSRTAGFRHHLTKPVSFDRLKSLVAEFAAEQDAARQPTPP